MRRNVEFDFVCPHCGATTEKDGALLLGAKQIRYICEPSKIEATTDNNGRKIWFDMEDCDYDEYNYSFGKLTMWCSECKKEISNSLAKSMIKGLI